MKLFYLIEDNFGKFWKAIVNNDIKGKAFYSKQRFSSKQI